MQRLHINLTRDMKPTAGVCVLQCIYIYVCVCTYVQVCVSMCVSQDNKKHGLVPAQKGHHLLNVQLPSRQG